MIYREFQGENLSMFALGTMRLPQNSKESTDIDVAQVRRMVAYAIENGVNYFDTAYAYHNGASESVIGEVLADYPRESFKLATKFPGYDQKHFGHAQERFEEQLQKCRVDYFDFYLFHNVNDLNIESYLDEERFGTYAYLIEQKRNGRIRHLGFSTHGSLRTMERFLEAFGADMEFCQIQLNWVDWDFQDAKEKIELLRKWNIPVWVMEPLRGGKLANLPEAAAQKVGALRPGKSAVEMSFRFLQSIPEVKVILSGSSTFEQLQDTVRIFGADEPTTAAENEALCAIGNEMTSAGALPCTACRYCTSHCPQNLDIPGIIDLYNEERFTGTSFIAAMGVKALERGPRDCLGCRSCEAVCPQEIKISDMMADFTARLEAGPFF